MKTNKKKVIYKIDSCLEKIKVQPYNVCNRPSYRTVCKKPIINRSCLAHDDYQNLLSTPKGYKWIGIASCYKKKKKNLPKQITHDVQRKSTLNRKSVDANKVHKNTKKQNTLQNAIKKKKVDEVNDDLKTGNKTQIQRNSKDNSMKKLMNIKAQGEADYDLKTGNKTPIQRSIEDNSDYFLKKKQSWLGAEKMGIVVEVKDKHKSFLNSKRKEQLLNEQKAHNIKTQVISEKKKFEERERLRKEAAKRLRIKIMKLEAKKKAEEEKIWRDKINQEFAKKMEFTINLNNRGFCMENKKGKQKSTSEKITYCDKLLDKNKNKQIAAFGDNIKKCKVAKNIEFKNYERTIIITESQNFNNNFEAKSYESCGLKNHKKKSRYKTPNVCCYSNTSINTVICRWKGEVNNMHFNMRKRRYDFVQRAKANNMWKY